MESISENKGIHNVKMFEINTIDQFNNLYDNDQNINVLIFSASWCGPCKRLKPQLIELIVKLRENKQVIKPIQFYFINVDNCISLSEHHKVSMVPTIIILNNSIEKYRTNEIDNIDEILLDLSMNIV